jgi:glycosyltransferase involved in cell wall biosynthesis
MNYKIIIPVYNEEKYIQELIDTFPETQKKHIIFIDDGSEDNTSQIINKNEIECLYHQLNIGKGKALETGSMQAINDGAEIIIFMDGDLQHNTTDIQQFLDAFNKDNDLKLVFGAREIGKKMNLTAFVGNKLLTIIINYLFKYYLSDTQCGFKAFKSDIFETIKWTSTNYSVETEIIINAAKNELKYCEVPIHTVYLEKYKGTNFIDGLKIFSKIIIWKLIK